MTYTVLRILTHVLGIVGFASLIPLAVAYHADEPEMFSVFVPPMALAWITAIIFRILARGKARIIGIQDAFGVVGGIWIAICIFGSIPLYLSGCFESFTDALFESVSGFTTTGATVLADVEKLPRSVNMWRCLSHWLGGMGVVALTVAMMPLLGAGGFRLIKAEATGPDKGKFTASIASTAKILWFIYIGMTAVQSIMLWYTGMDIIDAVAHSFSTVGTGGFSTRNASIGAFASPATEWICTLFMFLSSVNFALYCRIFTGRFSEVMKNSELRAFVLIVVSAVLSIFLFELTCGAKQQEGLFRAVCFQVVSVISSTGFMTRDYTSFIPACQAVILSLCLIGGCSGSTAGGVKVVRLTVLAKQSINEIRRLVHPYGVFSLRLNGIAAKESVVATVAVFIFLYLLLVFATAIIGALCGLDSVSAITGSLSTVGNIGPAFGSLGPSANYGDIPVLLKWWYMIAMLAGRLEIYTLLILIGCFVKSRKRGL